MQNKLLYICENILFMTITAKEYADMVGISGATVTRHLKNGGLPGVAKIVKIGNYWQLTLSKNFNAEKIKEKNFRNNLVV